MQGVLIDLEGVVFEGDRLVPGARQAIEWLVAQQIPFLFLTNTTSVGRRTLLQRLADNGIAVSSQQILTPVVAAARWLQRFNQGRVALFLSPEARADLSLLADDLLPESVDSGASCVIIGDLAEEWDFTVLNRAFRLLMSEEKPRFLALGMGRYWRAEHGLQLDVGPFVRALEYATGRESWQLGKPVDDFFLYGARLLGSEPDQTLVIGDDIVADIEGGHRAGMQTLLVRTGKYAPTDLEGRCRPDGVVDSIADLPDWFTV